jgi:hypothetical protein
MPPVDLNGLIGSGALDLAATDFFSAFAGASVFSN